MFLGYVAISLIFVVCESAEEKKDKKPMEKKPVITCHDCTSYNDHCKVDVTVPWPNAVVSEECPLTSTCFVKVDKDGVISRGCFDGWKDSMVDHDYRGCREQTNEWMDKTVWCFCDTDKCNTHAPVKKAPKIEKFSEKFVQEYGVSPPMENYGDWVIDMWHYDLPGSSHPEELKQEEIMEIYRGTEIGEPTHHQMHPTTQKGSTTTTMRTTEKETASEKNAEKTDEKLQEYIAEQTENEVDDSSDIGTWKVKSRSPYASWNAYNDNHLSTWYNRLDGHRRPFLFQDSYIARIKSKSLKKSSTTISPELNTEDNSTISVKDTAVADKTEKESAERPSAFRSEVKPLEKRVKNFLGPGRLISDFRCFDCNSQSPLCRDKVVMQYAHYLSRIPCRGTKKCFVRRNEDFITRGCADGWVDANVDMSYDGCKKQVYGGKEVQWCFCSSSMCNSGAVEDVENMRPDKTGPPKEPPKDKAVV